jgi:hypothetical protein
LAAVAAGDDRLSVPRSSLEPDGVCRPFAAAESSCAPAEFGKKYLREFLTVVHLFDENEAMDSAPGDFDQGTEPVVDVAAVREALGQARAAVAGVRGVLTQLGGGELAEFLTLVDEVKAQAGAAQVVIAVEAAHRGEFTSARRGEGSAHAWVREHAPSLRQAGAGQLAAFAADVAHATPGGQWSATGPRAGAFADSTRPEGRV